MIDVLPNVPRGKEEGYLDGKLLVAMPFMEDQNFSHSVIYICGHDNNGAIGLVLNKPLPSLTFKDLLTQLGMMVPLSLTTIPIHFGGPVELSRGFVLHSSDYQHESTIVIKGDVALTATLDILQDIASGKGPHQAILALGYTGWGAGQLEPEIQNNGWLCIEASNELIFSKESDQMWSKALASIGVDPSLLSHEYGKA